MNEEYIKSVYDNFGEEVLGSFEDFYNLISSDDSYKKNVYDQLGGENVFGAYKDFVSLVSTSVPAVKKKEETVTASVSEPGSLVSPGPEVVVEPAIAPAPAIDEIQDITAPDTDFFEERMAMVSPELIDRGDEDEVAQELTKAFKPYGFEVEPTSIGDAIKVTAANGNTIDVDLDPLEMPLVMKAALGLPTSVDLPTKTETTQAKKLRYFLNANRQEGLDAPRMFVTPGQRDAEVKKINQSHKEVNRLSQDYFKSERDFKDKYPQFQTYDPEYIKNNPEEYQMFLDDRNILKGEYDFLGQIHENNKEQGAQLDRLAGEYTEMLAKRGYWSGGVFYNEFIQGAADIAAGSKDFGLDTGYNPEFLMDTDPEFFKDNYLKEAASKGYDVPSASDMTVDEFKAWMKTDKGIPAKESIAIQNQIVDTKLKRRKRGEPIDYKEAVNAYSQYATSKNMEVTDGELSALRRGLDFLKDSESTPEAADLMYESFWGGALLGVTRSLPAMLMPGGFIPRTAAMYSQIGSALEKEMSSDPAFQNISESEKFKLKLAIGSVSAALESVGFSYLLAKKSITTGLLMKILRKSPKNITSKSFDDLVMSEVDSAVGRGLLTLASSGAVEFETGFFQEGVDIGFKSIYNEMKEKEMFETPDGFLPILGQMLYAGAQEAVGGLALGTPGAVSAARGNYDFTAIDDATFEMFQNVSSQSERGELTYRNIFYTDLQSKINRGEISKADAQQEMDNLDEVIAVNRDIPSDLTLDQQKKSLGILLRKKDLQEQIEGKDPILVKRQQEELNNLNRELDQILYGAPETDAIQEQGSESVETKRFQDSDVVLKEETFTITDEDGGRRVETVTTYLDGSLSKSVSEFFDKDGNSLGTQKPVSLGDNDIIVRDGLTAEQLVTRAADIDVVEKTAERSGIEINNPKKLAGLTTEQKQKLGIETKTETDAIQESSPESVDAQESTSDSEAVGEGVPDIGEPTAEVEAEDVVTDEAPAPTTEVAVEEGAEVELEVTTTDRKGRTSKFFKTTTEKDGVKTTRFTFNRSDKSPERRSKSRSTPVEEALGGLYEVEALPELMQERGVVVVAVIEVRESESGAAATVVFEQDGQSFEGEVVLTPKKKAAPKKAAPVEETVSEPTQEVTEEEQVDIDDFFSDKEIEGVDKVADNLVINRKQLSKDKAETAQGERKINRIKQIAKKAAVSLKKQFPDVRIVLHETEGQYKRFAGKRARAAYLGNDKTIHINLSIADLSTVGHEVFHALLLETVKNDPNAVIVSRKMLESIKKVIDPNSKLSEEIDKFVAKYADAPIVQDEEYLAELMGILSSEYRTLDKPAQNTIKEFLRKLAKLIGIDKKFGLDEFFGIEFLKTDAEVIDLLNTVSRKVSQGAFIEAADVAVIDKISKKSTPEELKKARKDVKKALDEQDARKAAEKNLLNRSQEYVQDFDELERLNNEGVMFHFGPVDVQEVIPERLRRMVSGYGIYFIDKAESPTTYSLYASRYGKRVTLVDGSGMNLVDSGSKISKEEFTTLMDTFNKEVAALDEVSPEITELSEYLNELDLDLQGANPTWSEMLTTMSPDLLPSDSDFFLGGVIDKPYNYTNPQKMFIAEVTAKALGYDGATSKVGKGSIEEHSAVNVWNFDKVNKNIISDEAVTPRLQVVTEEDGKPVTFYHGTDKKFDKFEPQKSTRTILMSQYEVKTPAIFFTPDEAEAREYGDNIIPVNLQFEKLVEDNIDEAAKIITDYYVKEKDGIIEVQDGVVDLSDYYDEATDSYNNNWVKDVLDEAEGIDWMLLDEEALVEKFKEAGFDGTKVYEGDKAFSVATFYPENIVRLDQGMAPRQQVGGIDPKDVRMRSRSGSRVGKGLGVRKVNNEPVVEEIPDLTLDYVRENAPASYLKNANLIAQYPLVRGIKNFDEVSSLEQADEVYEVYARQVADNLNWIMESYPEEYREISTLWYDGANKIANELAADYGVSPEQVAGIIASLSPQNDWYQNVRAAELLLLAFRENPVMSQKMIDYQVNYAEGKINDLKKRIKSAREGKGKSQAKAKVAKFKAAESKNLKAIADAEALLDLLRSYKGKLMEDAPDALKPYYVRLYSEVNQPKSYPIISPDGNYGSDALTDAGGKRKFGWGSYTEIGKGVSIRLDGSQENISVTLGQMHKIRNFFNNIIDPMSKEKDITMDTHAIAAALLIPASSKTKEVVQNFGTGTANSGVKGQKGLYYANQAGYFLSAEENNMLPRQVQSVTWEAVRGLFTSKFKDGAKNVKSINDIWENYAEGNITIEEARQEVLEKAGGINAPSWAGLISDESRDGDGTTTERGRGKRGGPATEREGVAPRQQKAPNGRPSNLNEEQYKIVRTPAFKKWFGDWENDPENSSKVVDENGEPMVMYHGTSLSAKADIAINGFDSSKGRNGLSGFSFMSEKGLTKAYDKGAVLDVFLNLKNPMDFEKNFEIRGEIIKKVSGKDIKEMTTPDWLEYTGEISRLFEKEAIRLGYDGVFDVQQPESKVFKNTNIKTADGSNTTFDTTSPSIRQQVVYHVTISDNKGNIQKKGLEKDRPPTFAKGVMGTAVFDTAGKSFAFSNLEDATKWGIKTKIEKDKEVSIVAINAEGKNLQEDKAVTQDPFNPLSSAVFTEDVISPSDILSIEDVDYKFGKPFDKSGEPLTEESFDIKEDIAPRQQLSDIATPLPRQQKSVREVVQQARDNNFKDAATKDFLKRKGVPTADIDKAIKTLDDVYARVMKEIDGVITKSQKRGVAFDTQLKNALAYLQGTKLYEDTTDIHREKLIREVRAKFDKKEKRAPSAKRILGKIKDVKKVTLTEKEALKMQLRLIAKTAKTTARALVVAGSELTKSLKAMVKGGVITANQMSSVLRRFSRVDLFNPASIDSFLDYMAKIFADAEYGAKIARIKKLLPRAKKNIKSKIGVADVLGDTLIKLFNVNPTLIPMEMLEDYQNLLEMMGAAKKVLPLADINDVTEMANKLLNAVYEEVSMAEDLTEVFANYENKVIKDGKVDYEATVRAMIADETISEAEATVMIKYKSRIVESTTKEPKTEEELAEERAELISAVEAAKVNVSRLVMEEERTLARQLAKLMSTEAIERLSNQQLETLLAVIDNINNGFVTHAAQRLAETMNASNRAELFADATQESKPLTVSKFIARVKAGITQNNKFFEAIKRRPLVYIDQLFGNHNTTRIYDSIFKPLAKASDSMNVEIQRIEERLDNAENAISKSFKRNPNKSRMSSYKRMTYMLQREFESNPDNGQVNPAADFIRATIDHIKKGKSFFKGRDAEMLQQILDDFGVSTKDTDGNDVIQIDSQKLYDSFNKAERNALAVAEDINKSLASKAVFTAAVIRGKRVNTLNQYAHHNVLSSSEQIDNSTSPSEIQKYNQSLRASTKSKNLIDRTGAVTPLNFDVLTSVSRGAKMMLTDFYLTDPIRTSRKTISNTRKVLEERGDVTEQEIEIVNAVEQALELTLDDLLIRTFTQSTMLENVVQYISRTGYRLMLASLGRFGVELFTNSQFVAIFAPKQMKLGLSKANRTLSMGNQLLDVMNNLGSTSTSRAYPDQLLSGRMIETSIVGEKSGDKGGRAYNDVRNKMTQIYLGLVKPGRKGIEKVADVLISTPDKAIIRPLWMGSFEYKFEEITKTKPDINKITDNDEAYMEANQEALDAATEYADQMLTFAGSADNPFKAILKGKSLSSVKQSAMLQAYNISNRFMTNFLIYEFISAQIGTYAMMGKGAISRRQGAALLGAVATRMVFYTLLLNVVSQITKSMFGLGDEEEEKDIEKQFGQALASTAVSLTVGRGFGNIVKGLLNFGVENLNEEFLDELREGDYDPYRDSIAYSFVPADKGYKSNTLADYLRNLMGSFGPFYKMAEFGVKTLSAEEKKDPAARLRQLRELNERLPLEVLGNLGLIPFYREIRMILLADIYKGMGKDKKGSSTGMTKAEKAEMKEYLPEMYEMQMQMEEELSNPELERFEKEMKLLEKQLEESLKNSR